jgi:hypothetical protein
LSRIGYLTVDVSGATPLLAVYDFGRGFGVISSAG